MAESDVSSPSASPEDPTSPEGLFPGGLDRRLAADLLAIGAVSLSPEDPFVWSSGLRAPLYCDNRRTLAHPKVRRRIAGGFEQVLSVKGWKPEVVAGTATAGIPHAAWLAERLGCPMAYVRSKEKTHGTGRRIEGARPEGQRILLIEDLVSTGQSALDAVEALRAAGADVRAVGAIFSYELEAAREGFASVDLPLIPLTGFSLLLDVARSEEMLSEEDLETLRRWKRDPEGWDAGRG